MAFFLSKSVLGLKNILDSEEKKDRIEREQVYLDDASAIQRVLCESESTRPVIQGVLAVNIQYISLFPIKSRICIHKIDFLKKIGNDYKNFYCEITGRNYLKKTKVILRDENNPLEWNQVLHIPINVFFISFVFHNA